jgi:hypothetical protein
MASLGVGRALAFGELLLQFSDPVVQLLNQRVALPQLGFQLGHTYLERCRGRYHSVLRVGHLI